MTQKDMLARAIGLKTPVGVYENGNYVVAISLEDGTKIRETPENDFRPDFAESIDCTITYKCDGNCNYCYAGCTPQGKHADLLGKNTIRFIDSLKPYTELAINGNDLTIPNLREFLEVLKRRDIICNITVNQRHFMKCYNILKEWKEKDLFKGLGVSLSNPDDEDFINKVSTFPNSVMHIVAGVFGRDDVKKLENKDLNLLLLGYKKKGRGMDWYRLQELNVDMRIVELRQYFLKGEVTYKKFRSISFDNLALKQFNVKSWVDPDVWEESYMGRDGEFTFFVDLVKGEFAKSSLSENVHPIDGRDAVQMFQYIKGESDNDGI